MVMADRRGLGFVGCILGGVTLAVAAMACAIVLGHLDGSLALEAAAPVALLP
jgi:hypothetical protein